MIDIRYKIILVLQSLYLLFFSILSFFLLKTNLGVLSYFCIWTLGIIANFYFVKKYILPSKNLLEKIHLSEINEDLSWIEIEEGLTRQEKIFDSQKKEFELENLKYKQLLDSQEDPVCILNKEFQIIFANLAFCSLFQLEKNDLPANLIEISRNLEFLDFILHAMKLNQTSRKSYFTFNQIQDPHKSYFDLKIFPIDNLSNYLCLFHDVTERKMADQMREDFVSNFSHEVRTPLTILNGQIQLLKADLQNDDKFNLKFSSYFLKIENNSRRLINLFNDLLRLTSVESKKDILKENINIDEMITFLPQDLLLNYPDKKIKFEFNLEQNIFYVDYNLFEQVLINLIDNSLKYIEESGTISITSYRLDDLDYLVIKDDGVGIPEDQLHRIFERFFRVDTSRSSEIKGTGLGLAIVKHIIQKHDGKIKANSNLNMGTSFTLSFPIK